MTTSLWCKHSRRRPSSCLGIFEASVLDIHAATWQPALLLRKKLPLTFATNDLVRGSPLKYCRPATEKLAFHDESEDAAERQDGISEAMNGLTQSPASLEKQGLAAPSPLLPHLITMSMLPKTQWQNLIHLDAIKVNFDLDMGASC